MECTSFSLVGLVAESLASDADMAFKIPDDEQYVPHGIPEALKPSLVAAFGRLFQERRWRPSGDVDKRVRTRVRNPGPS